jgi:PKD repeat protein
MVLHPETIYGWMFRLEIEDTYRCMVFASSDHQNVSWRPRLTITYTDCLPPTADFSYDAQQYTVYFTDQSSPVLSWNWDFGDGESSVQQNPVHTYQNPGTYIVNLTVEDSCSTTNHSDTIQIQCIPPEAGFYYTFSYPEVNFFGATTPPDIFSWYWDFGDESHSSQQNPVHIYDFSGIYNVCLYVIDSCASDSICQEVSFFPPMYHNIGFDPSTTNGLEVSFKDKTAGATEWLWDFGDAATSTLQNPVHVYTNYGNYRICMTGTYGAFEITSCDSLDLKEKIIDPVYKTTFYPNPPANNKITINFEKDAEYSDIKLFDLTGKIIWYEKISPVYKQQPVEIDLPYLRSGLYFIRIDLDGKQVVDKLSIP